MEILSLGEKIKRRRKELGMTLKDLAGDRITPGQISLVESGKSNPSMDLLEYLANTLNISIEYLMESEETQAEKICIYYENISESHILNNQLNLAEQYIENAILYGEKYNLEYRKAKNLYLRGEIYTLKKELGMAQQLFLSANVIFIKDNYYEDIINTYIKLGSITLDMQAYYSACSYFHQAEKVYEDNNLGNDFLIGQIFYYIANTYFKLEDIDKAINYSYLANTKFKKINNKKEYAKSLMLLSKEYSEKGDIDNAIKYSNKTLKILKEIDDSQYIAQIENNLGKLFSEFDNIEESFIHLNKAKQLREEFKDVGYIETLENICTNYIKLKELEKAKIVLEEILDNKENGDKYTLYKYYLLKYRIDMLEEEFNEAENTLILALKYAEITELEDEYAEISILLGKFYIDNGKDKEAAKYLSAGVEAFKKLGVLK
ncbi:helix-turn-helix transcriptional regulator [Clostridium botulinum C]|uniref:Helix-turn-helix transcriptional regulator n=2 Tax=Clostridium botulinum TaxID=1491 RepID=A0A9Q4XTC1_CLOBO|nr:MULTISPECIES: helix-turn-helix transcriptional regulator [Clostridium]KEI06451.1 XRE family transcriptional regulator [Clostridium sp. K25]MCD3193747.1 helix-turn-helix transcriptional regulator [Clostridium botulinum C]MCD3199815.1 helix-turn-helix transcriptional regulator [Clostridium botulinum C]MCD3205290.1 helix-turn-helix transcriptional regulator [Clostridium botulinum C]MCD3207216.1 helix-turn-helix transcriptional regulator [Clostridium botulinum C]